MRSTLLAVILLASTVACQAQDPDPTGIWTFDRLELDGGDTSCTRPQTVVGSLSIRILWVSEGTYTASISNSAFMVPETLEVTSFCGETDRCTILLSWTERNLLDSWEVFLSAIDDEAFSTTVSGGGGWTYQQLDGLDNPLTECQTSLTALGTRYNL